MQVNKADFYDVLKDKIEKNSNVNDLWEELEARAGKREKFKILMGVDDSTYFEEIFGTKLSEHFFVHKSKNRKGYIMTHIESGRIIGSSNTLADSKKMAQELEDFGRGNDNLFDGDVIKNIRKLRNKKMQEFCGIVLKFSPV